jgi:acetyltransferase
MILGGKEIIIGVNKDPQFGHLVMFGLGGIYVEVLKDVAFRLAPLTQTDVETMIREIRSYQLLAGIRGEEPSDINAIKDTLLKVSQLVTDFPDIQELDINPFKVFAKGGVALDTRIRI